ncbi:MAG: DUF58 domain-containing protein [Fimbriimonadaceae bacterium]|nr:DUF58 domain-containing protein [Chitinophagales bacterium]
MKNPFRNIYIRSRFYFLLGIVAVLFALSFGYSYLFPLGQATLIVFIAFCLVDIILLFNPTTRLLCERNVSDVFSLSDENPVHLELTSRSNITLHLRIIDELPYQLQKRDFYINYTIAARDEKRLTYQLRPVKRGVYIFRNINIFAHTFLGLIQRRFVFDKRNTTQVYPSILQMKKYELRTLSRIAFFEGVKKMRRIGHSYEFDQIKKYVKGDDIRSINWKATGRTGDIMVNHYEDEKAQQLFCILDKSRTMKMPFDELSLLDYAINASLVIANIAMRKYDKAGLITFSDTIGTTLQPDKNRGHLRKILETLYNEKERFNEANYELLYLHIRNAIKVRSLIFLFTNFESIYAIERVVNILRKINKLHLLVVIFFENDEIVRYSKTEATNLEDIYLTTIAEKFAVEKNLIRQELNKYGIQTIITSPADLSINTINKYLELKARGLI